MAKEKLHIVDAKTEYFISLDEILVCIAAGNYTDIYLVNHTKYPTIRIQVGQLWTKIKELGKMVEHHLERIGRSYIINMKYIQYVNPKKGKLTLHTTKDVDLKIPKKAADKLVKFVGHKEDKRAVTVFADKRKLTVGRHQLNDDLTFEKGRMYVDLGLPSHTMWATMNVGEGGLLEPYYAWGALSEYNTYSQVRYENRTGKEQLSEGNSLSPSYDIARQQWGGRWHMPTLDNYWELVNECSMTWCSLGNRRRAILVTGPNGNKIVLPVTGYYKDSEIRDDRFQAYYCVFNRIDPREKFQGLSVRPVFSPEDDIIDDEPTEKKKVIIFHEYFPDYSYDNTDEFPHAVARTSLKMGEWNIIEKSLPLDPDSAMEEVKKSCADIRPDIIVGITTACTYCNQITDCARIMIDPTCTASKKLNEHIDYGLKPGDSEERTKREELINKFSEFEKQHQFVASDKPCWVAVHNMPEQAVEGCRYVRLPNFNILARWRRVFLYPLFLKVIKNEPEKEQTTQDIVEGIISGMRRLNDGASMNREYDDEF